MDQATRLQHALGNVYRAGSYPIGERWQPACDPAFPEIADYLRVHVRRLDQTLELLRTLDLPSGARQVVDLGTWPPYHALMRQTLAPLDFVCIDDRHELDLESEVLPFAAGSTALVLLLEVIEHFYQDPMFALREVNRILQPGGKLVISTPNLASFRAVVAVLGHCTPLIYGKYTPGNLPHVHEFVPRELRILLAAAGFDALVWTANAYHSETPAIITDWLYANGFSPYEREDTIFAIATKSGAPRERYPATLYDGVPPKRRMKRTLAPLGPVGEGDDGEVDLDLTAACCASPPPPPLSEGTASIDALVDAAYYRSRAAIDANEDPIAHYLTRGAKEGYDPHPLFSTSYYLGSNPDVARAGVNPLEHYVSSGGAERRSFHPLFDTQHYIAQTGRHAPHVLNPLLHFLRIGVHHHWSPHPLIDVGYILDHAPELHGTDANPVLHCLTTGAAPHPLFDPTHYARQRPGVVAPLLDYVTVGAREGLSPHPLFDPVYYLDRNPDVAEAGLDPFAHYMGQGAAEQRAPHPLIDPGYYARQCEGEVAAARNALLHFVTIGARRGANPHRTFDMRFYEAQLARLDITTDNALVHFLTSAPTCDPHPTFDVRAYREKKIPLVEAGMNPLVHFVLYGAEV